MPGPDHPDRPDRPDLARMRRDYRSRRLSRSELAADPMDQLVTWIAEATAAGTDEPNAMSLATVDDRGRPSIRTVLCKGVQADGPVFYTNHESRKGLDLAADPRCALLFVWLPLERQVGIRGRAERVPAAQSDAYFASRPRGAQLGAWASPQSDVIGDRRLLLRRRAAVEQQFTDDVPRPANWGGYLVRPETVELWQGRPDRLHDRLRYRRDPDGDGWLVERLAP